VGYWEYVYSLFYMDIYERKELQLDGESVFTAFHYRYCRYIILHRCIVAVMFASYKLRSLFDANLLGYSYVG
jgi:hypothetical protein